MEPDFQHFLENSLVGSCVLVQHEASNSQGAPMANDSSADFFYLIDYAGNRYVPRKVTSRDGRFGYPIHPVGKGNDTSVADYTEDAKKLVQQVVLHGQGVRSRAEGGPQDGQFNTVGLSGRKIRGYWLCPSKVDWVAGARVRPENERAPV